MKSINSIIDPMVSHIKISWLTTVKVAVESNGNISFRKDFTSWQPTQEILDSIHDPSGQFPNICKLVKARLTEKYIIPASDGVFGLQITFCGSNTALDLASDIRYFICNELKTITCHGKRKTESIRSLKGNIERVSYTNDKYTEALMPRLVQIYEFYLSNPAVATPALITRMLNKVFQMED